MDTSVDLNITGEHDSTTFIDSCWINNGISESMY